jgi:hypothetical protein
MFGIGQWKKENCAVLIRERPEVFSLIWTKLLTHKKTLERYVKIHNMKIYVPNDIQPFYFSLKKKHYLLFFLENSTFVVPSKNLVDGFSRLLNQETLTEIKEASALSELYKPKTMKQDILILILVAGLGFAVGMIVGQFIHPGTSTAGNAVTTVIQQQQTTSTLTKP